MPFLELLGILVILVVILGFSNYVIKNFIPAEWQKYAMLVLGLVVVICVIWLVAALTGVGNFSLGHPLH